MNIKVEDEKERLDIFLSKKLDISRSKIQRMIKEGKITVNGQDIKPEKMSLDIVYEDEYLAVINKKSGMVVHPAVGNYEHTLVNGLVYHFNSISNTNTIRPGIVHRLDKDTSGLMVVAKNDEIHDRLSQMIRKKEIERKYLALVWGVVKHDKATIDAPIGRDIDNRQKYIVTSINSKDSITHFKVLKRYKEATLIECKLETGRTHQIRVHLNYIKHPIVNDEIYSNKKIFDETFGQMLHSKSIKFIHPVTGKEIYFEKDAPKEFYNILEYFDN